MKVEGHITCHACGMLLRIRPGRELTPEERRVGAWRPMRGPCVRPWFTVEDIRDVLVTARST